MPVSLIIADDHDLVRKGVNTVLALFPDMTVVAEASNGIEAIALAKSHEPDLMILDLALPHANGIEVIEELKRWNVRTRVVILTGMTSRGLLAEAKTSGAWGIFLKSEDTSLLADALPKILESTKVFSPLVAEMLSEENRLENLSARERQILHRLATGDSIADIAGHYNISVHTVDKHRTNIMRKLDVHSRGELMAVAIREGLLETARQK